MPSIRRRVLRKVLILPGRQGHSPEKTPAAGRDSSAGIVFVTIGKRLDATNEQHLRGQLPCGTVAELDKFFPDLVVAALGLAGGGGDLELAIRELAVGEQ